MAFETLRFAKTGLQRPDPSDVFADHADPVRRLTDRRWLPVLAPVPLLAVLGVLLAPSFPPGGFAGHMALHIAAMNVIAPLGAVAWAAVARGIQTGSGTFWLATALQISILWAWHLPAAQHFLAHGQALAAAAHGVLLASAMLFWFTLLRLDGARRWHGVLGLLITGKLFCLLAALLVFAPRALYGAHAPSLDDQQLAGLIMITACPLSYVLAGIVLTVQLVGPAQRAPRANAKA